MLAVILCHQNTNPKELNGGIIRLYHFMYYILFQHIYSAIYSVLFQHVHGKNVTFLFSCSRMLNDSLPVKPLSILFQLCLKRIDLKFAVQLHNDKLHIQFTCCTRSELKLNQREKREDQGFFFIEIHLYTRSCPTQHYQVRLSLQFMNMC